VHSTQPYSVTRGVLSGNVIRNVDKWFVWCSCNGAFVKGDVGGLRGVYCEEWKLIRRHSWLKVVVTLLGLPEWNSLRVGWFQSLQPEKARVRPAWFYLRGKWIAEKTASSKSCRLTPGAVLPEKLTVLRWLDSLHFLNPEGSLPSSQNSGHWPISCARSIQSTPSHPVSLRSTLILAFILRLGLQNCLFPSGFLI